MRFLKWLHQYAVWLNVTACVAVLVWAGWAWSVVYGVPLASAPMQLQPVQTRPLQMRPMQACPCRQPGNDPRATLRI